MKSSHLIHLVWAIVAVAAFTIGSQKNESLTDDEEAAQKSSQVESSSRTRDRSQTTRDGNSNRAREISRDQQIQFANLSDSAIRELGIDFKSAKTPLERHQIFTQILANLTPKNALLMREQIVHLDTDSSEFRDFHYQWGSIAGEEAVLNGAETPERDMATTLAGWTSADPEAALAYFNGLEADRQNGSGLKWGAVYGLVEVDPNLAVRFAMDRQEAGDSEANRLMDLIARQVIKSGDPAEAANWATTLPGGEMQDSAIRRISEEYAEQNPVAAVGWAETLPDGKGKNRAMRESFSEWARDNPTAAAERLSSLPDSPERDSAAYGFATRVAWEDPVAGVEWANTISDEKTRTNALMETGRAYFRKAPEAAQQWLSNSSLNAEQQKRVLSRSRRRG